MKRFLNRRNIIITVVVLAGLGIWQWRKAASMAAIKAKEKVVEVTRKDIESSLSVSGKIVSDKQATLTFPISGKLGYVGVAEGDVVRRGQTLMALDRGDLAAAEQAAYYRYLAADANAKQVEDEVKNHDKDETYAQKNTRVAAQTARDMAYDTWLTARRAFNNAALYAPFSGVVTNLTTNSVGDTVSITDGVTVVDPTSLHFEAEVDESDVGKIEAGIPVRIKLDAFLDREIAGKIKTVGYVTRISSTGATVFPVDISVEGELQQKFRIGMNGDAEIILGVAKGVLTLPVEAVNGGKVDLKNGNTVEVKIGLEGVDDLEITGGLNEGDKVIIK